MKLTGKKALITGGNSGIGLATARLFIAEDARVAITGRDQKTLDAAVAELGPNAHGYRADITIPKDRNQLFAELSKDFGKLDIVSSATGRIIPSGQIKIIQPLEIGVVKRIMVADGDHVDAGDVLIELDPTTNAADRDRLARDLMQTELDVARLRVSVIGRADAFMAPTEADRFSSTRHVSN